MSTSGCSAVVLAPPSAVPLSAARPRRFAPGTASRIVLMARSTLSGGAAVDDHVGTFTGEDASDLQADASRRCRDQRPLPAQLQFHVSPPHPDPGVFAPAVLSPRPCLVLGP